MIQTPCFFFLPAVVYLWCLSRDFTSVCHRLSLCLHCQNKNGLVFALDWIFMSMKFLARLHPDLSWNTSRTFSEDCIQDFSRSSYRDFPFVYLLGLHPPYLVRTVSRLPRISPTISEKNCGRKPGEISKTIGKIQGGTLARILGFRFLNT